MKPAILVELINRALVEPLGLAITTNNTRALAKLLHETRRQLGAELHICIPSLENTVFIVHRSVELD